MEQILAQRLAGELGVHISQVAREYWEIAFLDALLASRHGENLVFRGGTALRLAYGSPRFSEDLDFALLRDSLSGDLEDLAASLAKRHRQAEVTNVAAKRWTYLVEIRVTEDYLDRPFRVKVEISRRPARGYKQELRLVSSPTSPLQPLARVATLSQLYRDKKECIAGRAAAKDLFDLWFICQRMRMPYEAPRAPVDKKTLRRDLHKFLPRKYWPVIEELA
jgi:predicted nucleotidyltransferase component of viral defense system